MRAFPRLIGAVYTSLTLVLALLAMVDGQQSKPLDRFLQPAARATAVPQAPVPDTAETLAGLRPQR